MTERTSDQEDARRRVDAALAGMLQEPVPVDGQLREQIARWLIRDIGSTRDLDDYTPEVQRDFLARADALLPVLSDAIAEAKAEAWDVAFANIKSMNGVDYSTGISNPYRTPKETP